VEIEAPARTSSGDCAAAANDAPLLYTAKQAAERLGVDGRGRPIVSAFWLERRAAARAIPCRYLGTGKRRRLAFSEADLRALVEQFRSDPADYGRERRSGRP
jgi:hypothetical protein